MVSHAVSGVWGETWTFANINFCVNGFLAKRASLLSSFRFLPLPLLRLQAFVFLTPRPIEPIGR